MRNKQKYAKPLAAVFLCVMLIAGLAACSGAGGGKDDKKQEIVSEETGVVYTFPGSWEPVDHNKAASIEMEDPARDVLFLVIEEPLSDFSPDVTDVYYGDLVTKNITEAMDPTTLETGGWETITVGKAKLPGVRIKITGTINKKKAETYITVVKSAGYFHQMVAAAGASDFKDAAADFEDILATIDFGDLAGTQEEAGAEGETPSDTEESGEAGA